MLGNRIKNLRIKQSLTQKELAEKINISEQSVAHYEANRRKPSPEMIKELANLFGVTTDYLLGNDIISKEIENSIEEEQLSSTIRNLAEEELGKTLFKKYGELDDERKKVVLGFIEGLLIGVEKEDSQ